MLLLLRFNATKLFKYSVFLAIRRSEKHGDFASASMLSPSSDRWILLSFLIVLMLFSAIVFYLFSLALVRSRRHSFALFKPIKVCVRVENNCRWLSPPVHRPPFALFLRWQQQSRIFISFHISLSRLFDFRKDENEIFKSKTQSLNVLSDSKSIIKPFLWIEKGEQKS